jgi:MbtH protein
MEGMGMIRNPFDDTEATFRVLMNEEGQYSLWPTFAAVPAGWNIVHGEDTREACCGYIAKAWTDMRPRSARVSPDTPPKTN